MIKDKNKISSEEIKDKILQLIFLAEVNLECCNVIHNLFKRQKEKTSIIDYNIFLNQSEENYLVLSANNHFFNSVGIIHSLLHQTRRKKKELSFQLYEEKVLCEYCCKDETNVKEFLSWIEDLREEFKKEKFPGIRDKICAHKELKNIGDPSLLAVLPIDNKWVKTLQEIIKELKEGVSKFFKDQISNNYLMDRKWGLENILDKVVEENG